MPRTFKALQFPICSGSSWMGLLLTVSSSKFSLTISLFKKEMGMLSISFLISLMILSEGSSASSVGKTESSFDDKSNSCKAYKSFNCLILSSFAMDLILFLLRFRIFNYFWFCNASTGKVSSKLLERSRLSNWTWDPSLYFGNISPSSFLITLEWREMCFTS